MASIFILNLIIFPFIISAGKVYAMETIPPADQLVDVNVVVEPIPSLTPEPSVSQFPAVSPETQPDTGNVSETVVTPTPSPISSTPDFTITINDASAAGGNAVLQQNVNAGGVGDTPVVSTASSSAEGQEAMPCVIIHTPTPTPSPDNSEVLASPSFDSLALVSSLSAEMTPSPSPSPSDVPQNTCVPASELKITQPDGLVVDEGQNLQTVVEIINTNDVKVTNNADVQGISGRNAINSEPGSRYSEINSGEVNLYANVVNVVNTNLVNSDITQIFENFNNLSTDLLLNNPDAGSSEITKTLAEGLCGDAQCQNINSFKLTNKNSANITNNVSALGVSGENQINNTERAADIHTGDVNAVINILNIVNTNLINSHWTISSINIFGDWKGDLVLPSEMYFADHYGIGPSVTGTNVNADTVGTVNVEIANTNTSTINNNVLVDASSGGNEIAATGSTSQDLGEIRDGNIQTGDSLTVSNVNTFTDSTIYNGKWYLGMVNTLGAWSGSIYSIPDQVALAQTPNGLAFFSASAKDTGPNYGLMEATLVQASETSSTSFSIDNENTANINNNVDLRTDSGNNSVEAESIRHAEIFSGNTKALANILNFANTNLINADLFIGMINIFGTWDGNVIFGYPDLSVIQSRVQPVPDLPTAKNQPVTYRIGYGNEGESSMADASLEWRYNPSFFTLDSVAGIQDFTASQSLGMITFSLGKLAPKSQSSFDVTLDSNADFAGGETVQTYARIGGMGPEQNLSNNESVLTETVLTPAPATSPALTPDSGSSGNQQDSQQQNNDSSTPSGNQNQDNSNQNGPNNESTQNSQNQNVMPVVNPTVTYTEAAQYSSEPVQTAALVVSKTNDAASSGVRPHDVIQFTVVAHNVGGIDMYSVIVYDTLRGPDGQIMAQSTYPLDTLAVREQAEISYSLEIPENVKSGVYTNSAYVEAINSYTFRKVISEVAAISSFSIIGNSDNGVIRQKNQLLNLDEPKKDEPVLEKVKEQAKKVVVQAVVNTIGANAANADSVASRGEVKGASTFSPENQSAELTQTDLVGQNVPVTKTPGGKSQSFPLLIIISALALLFAIGNEMVYIRGKSRKPRGKPKLKRKLINRSGRKTTRRVRKPSTRKRV